MSKTCKITALVPMKGKSQRVKGKNLRIFVDKPLCMHILGTLEACDTITHIVVNTDSDEIASLVRSFSKVIIHPRPEHLWGHDVPMNDIIAWDIEHDETEADHFLQTHATNPILSSETITKAVIEYLNNMDKYDSLFSVTPYQARFYNDKYEPINHNPKELLKTQDLEPIYEENSSMYIFSKKSFKEAENRRIGNNPKMYIMNKIESMDIDTEEEFLLAENIFKTIMHDI